MIVASEAALFAYLLFAYYYTGASPRSTLGPGGAALSQNWPFPTPYCYWPPASWPGFGERGILDRQRGKALLGFGLAFLMGAVFAVVQGYEWVSKPYSLGTSSYASLYFVYNRLSHGARHHRPRRARRIVSVDRVGYFSPRRRLTISSGVLYWHFVDVVWLFVFSTYYLTPYLGFGT